MRKPSFVFLCALIPVVGFCQRRVPVPPDPLELVTSGARVANTDEARAPLIALVNDAIENYQLHANTSPANALQISFHATASTLFPGGDGQLRETWISSRSWRWDASFGAYSLLRIRSNGVAYDERGPRPLPLRLKMLHNAVFAPIQLQRVKSAQEKLRSASVTWKGTPVTCILVSPRLNASAPSGARDWNEVEYCIDPATDLLDVYSEAPGVYVSYDYTSALRFHEKLLPRKVSIFENGTAVIEAQLTGIVDADAFDPGALKPTAQMIAQGPALELIFPARPWTYVWSTDMPARANVEPTIVHLTLDEHGAVEESEALQTWSSSSAALAHVLKKMKFDPVNADGGPPRQRELYLDVEFHPCPGGGCGSDAK